MKKYGHFITSMLKSAIRICGFYMLLSNIVIAAGLLIIAEILGIIEQMFDMKK